MVKRRSTLRKLTDPFVGKKSPYYRNTGGELMEKTKGGMRTMNLERAPKPKGGRAKITSVRKGTKYGVTPSGVKSAGASPAQRRRRKPVRRKGLATKGKPARRR